MGVPLAILFFGILIWARLSTPKPRSLRRRPRT